ncbi:Solute carrier family 25 member 43 [Varanus komodoensis]|nr:Solute carrier family 25 member 43 [Varanus komodoensis]
MSTLEGGRRQILSLKMLLILQLHDIPVFSLEQAQSACLPSCGGVDIHFVGMADCFKQTVKMKGWLALWNGLAANLLRIVPYFGIMFSTFEFCKRVCLYQNGYIDSPLSYKPTPGVDQSLQPQELQELKFLGRRNF